MGSYLYFVYDIQNKFNSIKFLLLLDLEEDEAQLPGLELLDDLDPNPSFSFTLVPNDFLPLDELELDDDDLDAQLPLLLLPLPRVLDMIKTLLFYI